VLQHRSNTGVTVFEPTDDVVVPWEPCELGIQNIKAAFYVSVRLKRDKKRKLSGHPIPIYKPVVLSAL
jgi:hypothetical protein